ncbi:MAG: tetratricopeptide repeat protein, partial [Myxococcota bacterium]
QVAVELNRVPDTLLVCDNLEHIITAIREPLTAWLRDAPQTRFLTTSRQRLGLPEEMIYELGPLQMDSPSDGESSDAARMFIDRATAVWPDFVPQDLAQLEAIVALLDGVPLAIELAAARLRVLGPTQLLERLSKRFTLLRSSSTHQVNRQWETLWGALEWSWQLLEEHEQECLLQCVHFVGGFTLDAAEATVDLGPEMDVMDVVQALRDKSLLRAWTLPSHPGILRLGFFQSVREFVLAKRPGGEDDLALTRMTTWFLHEGESFTDGNGATHLPKLREWLDAERSNLAELVRLHLTMPDHRTNLMRLLLLIEPAVLAHGPHEPYAQQLDRALEMEADVPPGLHALILKTRARFFMLQRKPDRELESLKEAEALSMLADQPWIGWDVMSRLGLAYIEHGYTEEGRAQLERTRTLLHEAGESKRLALVIGYLARHHNRLGQFEEAQTLLEEAVESLHALGDRLGEAMSLNNLAVNYRLQSQFEQAHVCLDQALALSRADRHRRGEASILYNFGTLQITLGNLGEAHTALNRSLQLFQGMGEPYLLARCKGDLGVIHQLEGDVKQALTLYPMPIEVALDLADIETACRYYGYMAAALAGLGQMEEAEDMLARAEGLLGDSDGHVLLRRVLDVHRGHLDLAYGHPERAQARVLRAVALVDESETLPTEHNETLLITRRLLVQQLKQTAPTV